MNIDNDNLASNLENIANHMAANFGTGSKRFKVFSNLSQQVKNGVPLDEAITNSESLLERLNKPKPQS